MVVNYLEKLEETLNQNVERLALQMAQGPVVQSDPPSLLILLKAALKNEWETSLLTANWIVNESDTHFAMKMARLAGDEAKHFALIADQLIKMNCPLPPKEFFQELSPLFKHLLKYQTTFDRIVAGPFTRESLAVARNNVFLNYCKAKNHSDVIAMYEIIQQDEKHHFNLGREQLASLLKNESDFNAAVSIVEETLKVVTDIQEMMILKKGLSHLPGC